MEQKRNVDQFNQVNKPELNIQLRGILDKENTKGFQETNKKSENIGDAGYKEDVLEGDKYLIINTNTNA